MITEISRGKIRFTYKNVSYSAEGELLLPDDDTVNFVLYWGSVRSESSDKALSELDKKHIIRTLQREFENKGRTLIVED